MNKYLLYTLIGVIGLAIGTFATIGLQAMTVEPAENCEPEKVVEACDEAVLAEVEIVEEIDFELITYGTKGGDLVVLYDGKEVIETTITIGDYSSAYVVGTDEENGYVYIAIEPDGMGGYILFSGDMWVSRIDISDWSYMQMFSSGYMTDISIEHQKMVVRDSVSSTLMISIIDLETWEKNSYSIDSQYGQAGNAYLSPDGTKVAYAVAVGDPSDEYGAVYLIDMEENTHVEYAPHARGVYKVSGWADNNTINYTLR
jgi:hypothetical protein